MSILSLLIPHIGRFIANWSVEGALIGTCGCASINFSCLQSVPGQIYCRQLTRAPFPVSRRQSRSHSDSAERRESQLIQPTFTFFVQGKEYSCELFQACFLSPIVSRLLATDCTVDYLNVDIGEESFSEVLSLVCGQSITVTQDNKDMITSTATSLENEELCAIIDDLEFHDSGTKLEVELSPRGMSHLYEIDDRKWTFLVGDEKHVCPLSQACFISPLVSRLLEDDPTLSSYLDRCDCFSKILTLGLGETVISSTSE